MKRFWKPIAAILIFLLAQLVAGLFSLIATAFGIDMSVSISIALILSSLLAGVILWMLRIVRPRAFRIKKIKWKYIPLALAAATLGIFSMNLLGEQLHLPDIMKEEFLGMSKSAWGIAAICLFGPIMEELVFREAIIGSLVRHRVHRRQAILISALAFGLIHINPAQIPFAFTMGIILGIIYAKTGNVIVTGFIHILNNTLAVTEMILLGDHIDEFSYSKILGGRLMTWGYIVVCSFLCYIFLQQFWAKYHR